jgi:photosystem II stability/assembly factor-like uncharacterized protein
MHTSIIRRFGFLASLLVLVGAGCVSFSGGSTSSAPAGVFVSSDKGESWEHLVTLPEADGIKNIGNLSLYRVFEDPQDPNTMYVGTRGQGMYYTYDNGFTWQKPNFAPLNTGFIYSVAVHPKDKCLIFATNGNQVFKSVDCSRTWAEVYRDGRSGIRAVSLAFANHAPYTLYMAQSGGDLVTTNDAGASWTTVQRFGLNIAQIVSDKFQPNRLYLTTRDSGLHRSDDAGSSWTDLTAQLSDISGAIEYRGFVQHPTKQHTIYWLSTYGIIYSTNAGETWNAVDLISAPGSVNIYGFGVNPKNDSEMYYTATLKDLSRSTFYKSIDGGVNWTTKKMPSSQVPTVLRVHPIEGYIYLGFTIPPEQK